MAMLFKQFTPKECIEYDRLFRQAAGQDAYLPWDCLNNQIFVYTFTSAHAHTFEVRDQTFPFRDAIQLSTEHRQFQQDHSFCLDCSVCSDCPFCTNCPFQDSGQLRPETAHQSHPGLAHHQGQQLPTMSSMMHPAPKFERYIRKCTLSDCRYAHLCWTPGCYGYHPGKGCPKRPNLAQPSLNTLTTRSV